MFINKLNKHNGDAETIKLDTKGKKLGIREFVAPLYGGNEEHILNQVTLFNKRICFGVHLHCNKYFEFGTTVHSKAIAQKKDHFDDDIHTTCSKELTKEAKTLRDKNLLIQNDYDSCDSCSSSSDESIDTFGIGYNKPMTRFFDSVTVSRAGCNLGCGFFGCS